MKPTHVIRNTFLTGLCIGLLTGCSWLGDWPPGKAEKTAQSAPRPPESKIAGNNDAAAAQPKESASGSDTDARIAQLEATVAQLRNDIRLMMPALTRLAQMQGDVQKDVAQIEPAAGAAMQPPMAITQPVTQNAPDKAPEAGTVAWYEAQERAQRQVAATQVAAPQPAAGQQGAIYQSAASGAESAQREGGVTESLVTNVRFGEHPDKTRLVLDTSDMVAFSYDMDNNGRILTVSLPQTGWAGPAQMDVGNSPLVASYRVEADDRGGQRLTVHLKHAARVLWAQALMPGGPQGHRIVFDLAPL